ncbi:FecR family protein [Bacteroides sp. 519]|uniref:FecR family protein n=1 Tax=Bacteroides sp. 519 TaxID=2302937 RepID=UPI0013CFDB59|nr:FecR family protein [Bacteroides sp. 519]NDV57688.1 FecR family protein [Bacteroides sp. 519]
MNQTTLHKYFRGDTSETEEKFILDWVEESEDNRKLFQKERMLYDITLFHNTTEKKNNNIQKRSLSITKWTVRIAASVIVILSGWTLLRENQYRKEAPLQTITVPAGQRAEVMLADGTKVWLNSKSTLTYAANFGKNNRKVELDGEAYFEVTKNTKMPFFVHTETNKIGVVGTSFNVNAYRGTNEFETILVEGIVDIYNANATKPITRLEKDEIFSSNKDNVSKRKSNANDYLRWKEGVYAFDDSSFEYLINKLEKYYNVKFIIDNNNVMDYHVTGKFRAENGVEHILKTIQKDHCKFNYSINKDNDTIRIY